MIDPVIIVSAKIFLAALLLLSGLHKAMDIQRFQQAVAGYQLLPANLINTVAIMALFSELFTGTLLIVSAQQWPSIAAALIFALYFFAMLINIYRGRTNVDCGCSFSTKTIPLSRWNLLRNGLLVAMAALTLGPSTGRALMGFDIAQIGVAILCLGLLYFAFETLLANRIYILDKET